MRRLKATAPAGLRWRLTAWVAGVLMVSAAAMFLVVYNQTGSELGGQIDRDIASDTAQLSQSLSSAGQDNPTQIATVARHYMLGQPYTATSTLLFVLIGGAAPASNHPELFATPRAEPGETTVAQAQENQSAHRLLTPRAGYSTQRVPDVGRMRIHERVLSVGGRRVVAGAGEPLAIVERAQHGVARAFLLAGVLILALALLASYLAGARVSAPLRRLASVAARVDAGELAPRMDVSGDRRDEVRVLAEAFNHMLDRLAEAFRSQREFVADASHELRTPLTVIRGQLEVLAAQEDPPATEVRRVEQLVQAELTRIERLVDDLLMLARADQTNFLRIEPIELGPFLDDLWDGISLTAERRFELGPVASGTLRADPDRLAQALRNLARNAIDHTAAGSGLVRLDAVQAGAGSIRFTVIDDGPGIPAEERDRVFERFHRTDAARSRSAGGAGLGLAIVRAIADAHGGQVRAGDPGASGGARVELVLPGWSGSFGREPTDLLREPRGLVERH